MHRLPVQGSTDSLAEVAFVRARALDSTAATQQFHLVEILARKGESTAAAALARQFVSTAADTQLTGEVNLVSACAAGVMKGVDLRAEAVHRPLPLLLAAKSLGASQLTSACALVADEMLIREDTLNNEAAVGRRFFVLLGLVNVRLTRGEVDLAVRTIEAFRLRWGSGRSLYLLAAPVVPALRDSARAVARQDSVDTGPNYTGIRFPVRLWELGIWAAQEGRPAIAHAVAADLEVRAAKGVRVDTLLAQSMAAHAALAGGDSLQALRRLEALLAHPAPVIELTWNEAASLGFDRLTLGRLLIWRKEYARAIDVLNVHDSALPAVYPLYQRASLTLRVEAAEALNDPALTAALRARVAALSRR
jgi:hypothetical protein